MASLSVPYFECIKRTLHAALCIGNYPSRGVERHNKPEVEVAGLPVLPEPGDKNINLLRRRSARGDGGANALVAVEDDYHTFSPELLLNPVLIARSEQERCLIETSVNSVRVSVSFQKSDHLAELIAKKYVGFLEQRADFFFVLRKKPIPGYDMSFLITHEESETMHINKIIDFIVTFVMDIDKDVTGLKLHTNERARRAAMEFFQTLSF